MDSAVRERLLPGRVRDLLLLQVAPGRTAVIGCDSCGGIGPKPRDAVRVPAYTVARFTARVALMEVAASGATPAALVSTLCSEPDPVGLEVARGIADELAEAGLDRTVAVTGSSEKNVPTEQTGLGVTVIGFANEAELRFGRSLAGDHVVCVGVPKVGPEVFLGDPDIADLPLLWRLLKMREVHEVVPAGSRGVIHEARELAASGGFSLELCSPPGIDLRKSAGPATCLVVTIEPGTIAGHGAVAKLSGRPLYHVGCLR
ncbi:MAG: AIR synthase related protein [Bacillota bacterium]